MIQELELTERPPDAQQPRQNHLPLVWLQQR